MKRHDGFTLIELLVVISIVSLLVSILLPALASARKNAQAVQCKANLHNVSIGVQLYVDAFNDRIPHLQDTSKTNYTQWVTFGTWFVLVGDQMGWNPIHTSVGPAAVDLDKPNIIHCPTVEETDWTVNHFAPSLRSANLKLTQVIKPTERVYVLDSQSGVLPVNDTHWFGFHPVYLPFWPMRHNEGANHLYLDGHVKQRSEDEFRSTGNVVFKWTE